MSQFPPDQWEVSPSSTRDWNDGSLLDDDGTHFTPLTGGEVLVLRHFDADATSIVDLNSDEFPIEPDVIYKISTAVIFSAQPPNQRFVEVSAFFLDGNKDVITGLQVSIGSNADDAGTWIRGSEYGAAPPNARYMRLEIAMVASGAGASFDAGVDHVRVEPSMPAFCATRTTNQSLTANSFQTAIFNVVSAATNTFDRGGYSTSTGIFTAPVAGEYTFQALVGAGGFDAATDRIELRLRVNGDARALTIGDTPYSSAVVYHLLTTSVALDAGDEVDIQINPVTSAASPVMTGNADGSAARFSGHMIG